MKNPPVLLSGMECQDTETVELESKLEGSKQEGLDGMRSLQKEHHQHDATV